MKYIRISIIILFTLFIILFRNRLYAFYVNNFVSLDNIVSEFKPNEYYIGNNYSKFKNTNKFIPDNKDDIINIYYTFIDSGMDEFTFYCKNDYENCIDDTDDIANNQNLLSSINDFVHPFNSFKTIKTEFDSVGRVTISNTKVYSERMIYDINDKIDSIILDIIKDDDSIKNIIKKIHDYIIVNTDYDKNRSDNNIIDYESDNAYGVLVEGYGICSGYSDSMSLFLNRFKIPNFKISTINHVWNYVFVDDKWLHVDLTWDDPINSKNKDYVDYDFFLINDSVLKTIEAVEHNYDKDLYKKVVD